MAASDRTELRNVILDLVVKSGRDPNGSPIDDASLIRSGLIESMALLELAEWISGRLDAPVDLTKTDILREWDTVDGILAYMGRSR